MKKRFFIFSVLTMILTFNSCKKDDAPNFHFVPLSIVSADLPEFFTLNQTYAIRVVYNKPDACTSFGGFDVTPEELTTRNVVVIGTRHYDQEACTQTIEEGVSVFNFNVVHSQTYTFKFWQGEDADGNQEYLEVEVPVM